MTIANGLAIDMYSTYDFNPENELVMSVRMVAKDPARDLQVICSGVARGKWSVASDTVTMNINEDLIVALESAVESGKRLSGPIAASRGFVCPDTPLAPRGDSEEHKIIELTDTTLRLKGISPQGPQVIDTYERIPR